MKKILSGILSVVCLSAVCSTFAVNAKTAELNENITLHGNMCGTVTVTSEIDRDVHIKIDCETPDAPAYHYYDCVIPADEQDKVLDFKLEGDNEAVYKITVGVPKYKGSDYLQNLSEQFYVYDTEEITAEEISGYQYSYNVLAGEELKIEKVIDNVKDENNVINNKYDMFFTISDALVGDANLDGKVDVRDCAYIARMLAAGQGNELPDNVDFNDDGEKNVRDAAAIARYLANREK